MSKRFPIFLACFLAVCIAIGAKPLAADTLRNNLLKLAQTHKRMLAANADVKAAMENLEVTWGE